MILSWIFVFTLMYFEFVDCATINNKEKEKNNTCITTCEKNQEIMEKLSEYLETVEKKNLQLEKVLGEVDEFNNNSITNHEDSLESVLFQHQLILHHELKEMFAEIKDLFSHQRRSHDDSALKSDVYVNNYSNGSGRAINITDNKLRRNKLSELDNLISFNGKQIYAPTDTVLRPSDCSELLVSGHTESGVYDIYPFKCRCTKSVKVFCDMETDGGGWTLFLKRLNASQPISFSRNWEEYKNGFGLPEEEYWLGNEALHTMTSSRNYVLRLDARNHGKREIWGEWNSIVVQSEDNRYRLVVDDYNDKSTSWDAFNNITNNFFSTYDSDNDKSDYHCAQLRNGGWWYRDCHHINPTGVYGSTTPFGIWLFHRWPRSNGKETPAVWLQLKIRPRICSSSVSVSQFNKHNCA